MTFANVEDANKVLEDGPYIIEMTAQPWTTGFDQEKQKASSTLVWVQYPGLRQEYWTEKILIGMSATLGKPVKVDELTLKKTFGYYASVLVEIDFSKPIDKTVYVQSSWDPEGYAQVVEIPKHPGFCEHCKVLGHSIDQCKAKSRVVAEKIVATKSGNVADNNFRNRRRGNRKRDFVPPTTEEVNNNNKLLQARRQSVFELAKGKKTKFSDNGAENLGNVYTGKFDVLKNMDGTEADNVMGDNQEGEGEEVENVYDESSKDVGDKPITPEVDISSQQSRIIPPVLGADGVVVNETIPETIVSESSTSVIAPTTQNSVIVVDDPTIIEII
ncbi:uncharacterized protein LOC113296240 [Papaver somniferum]|uniref:uncharacterized protein LOC113296240 n=1 Tax=Papaver somniferum TaxID=3469 RepID=UPI000E704624|nr:uncharacterized protein LOC113296240 [Papaver somniferum]